MTKLRKIFTVGVMFVTVLSMSVVVAPNASAAASAGDLIKAEGVSAVYYLGSDNMRYVFPTEQTYFSWYSDFSGVITVPQSELESYDLGGNLTVRPGTKLVQEVSMETPWTVVSSKVYAVESGGSLVQIPDADTAAALYGSDWEMRIVGVPSAYFTNYTNSGTTASADVYPEGSLIKLPDSADIYYINADGEARMIADEAALAANRFDSANVITAAAGFTLPTMGDDITGAEADLTNTAQGGSSGSGITPGAGTGLSVALASDTPVSTSIPASATANRSATNVSYTKINLTAANDGDVTVNSLTFHRTGVGSAADFAYVYLYEGENRLTTGRSVNTSSNNAVFNNLGYVVPAGTTKSLTLKADIGTNTTGADAFELVSTDAVTTDGATVSGSFPITGNTMALTGVSVGKLTVTAGADPSDPSVGSQDVAMAQFKLAATGEDINVQRIALYQAGSVSNTNLSNFKLKYGSTELASVASINSANLVVFNLTNPFLITKGQTKTLDVTGDINGSAKDGDTIIFYIENSTDVYGVGTTYEFGVGVDYATSGTYDGSSAAKKSDSTISGGQLTFSTNGPTASNVRGNDVDLLNFSLASGVSAEVRSLRLELYYGGVKAGATSTNGYITNVQIVDTDTNAVVWGPIDLGNTSSWTDIGSTGSYHDFTDVVSLDAGETRNFKVTADLNDNLDNGGVIHAVIGSTAGTYVLSTTAGAKNIDNNQWITDIVPSSQITGNDMTFTSSALTANVSATPATATVVKGTNDISSAGITFQAGSSSGASVTSIKVAGYLSTVQTGGGFALYTAGGDNVTDSVGSLYLVDADTGTQIGATKSFDTSGYAQFTGLNIDIPANGSKLIIVKTNTTNTATTTGAYAVGVVDPSTDVTAYDENDNAITLASTAVNVGASPSVYMKLSSGGTLTASINDSTYPTAIVASGSTGVGMLSAKFYATNEALKVTKLRVTQSSTANSDLQSITITYPTNAAGTETRSQTTVFVSTVAEFTGMTMYVPKNDWANVTIKANIGVIDSGATSGDSSSLALNTTNFEAVSAEGGTTKVTTFSGTVSGATNHIMYIKKSVPTISSTQSIYSGTTIGGNSKLAEFKVAASNGTVALKKIKLNVSLSDAVYGTGKTDLSATDVKLYRNGVELTAGTDYRIYANNDADGNPVATSSSSRLDTGGTGSLATTTNAFYIVFDAGGVSGGEETISAGTSNTYAIGATLSGYVGSEDQITTSIAGASDTTMRTTTIIEDANYYVDVTGASNANFIWSDLSDGATHSSVIDAAAATDWSTGYKVVFN